MVGPDFKKHTQENLQQEHPWQSVLDYIKKAAAKGTVKEAVSLLVDLTYLLEGQKVKSKNPAPFSDALSYLDGVIVALRKKGNSEFSSFLQGKLDYVESQLGQKTESNKKKDNEFYKTSETAIEEVKVLSRDIAGYYLQVCTGPNNMYGTSYAANQPSWAKSLSDSYDRVKKLFSNTNEFQKELDNALENEIKNPDYLKIVKSCCASKDKMEASLEVLTLSQKLVDGMTLLMNSRYLGASGIASQDLEQFFGFLKEYQGGDKLFARLVKFADGDLTESESKKLIGELFETFTKIVLSYSDKGLDKETILKLANHAVDASYGENAGTLNALIVDLKPQDIRSKIDLRDKLMGERTSLDIALNREKNKEVKVKMAEEIKKKTEKINKLDAEISAYEGKNETFGSSLEKLQYFFEASMDELSNKKGAYSQTIKDIKSNHSGTWSELLSQQVSVPSDAPGTVKKNKYDFATVMSFIFAYDKLGIKDNKAFLNDPTMTKFVQTIGGLGNYSLPPEVPMTILQNYSTMDEVIKRLNGNQEGFIFFSSQLTQKLTKLYSLPFGYQFPPEAGASNRFEAAQTAMARLKYLNMGNAFLDNLMERYLKLIPLYATPDAQNYVQLKDPFFFVLAGGLPFDRTNLRQFMNSLGIQNPDQFFQMDMPVEKLEEQVRKYTEFARKTPAGVEMPYAYPPGAYDYLLATPTTYALFLDEIFNDIFTYKEKMNITGYEFAGDVRGTVEEDKGKVTNISGYTNGVLNTSTGFVKSQANINTSGISNQNTSQDNTYYDVVTQARNLYLGQTNISNSFTSFLQGGVTVVKIDPETQNQTEEEMITTQIIQQTEMSIGKKNIYLYADRYYDDMGNSKTRLNAVFRVGRNYFKAVNIDEQWVQNVFGEQIAKHQQVVEFSQAFLPIGSVGIVEHQNADVPKDSKLSGKERFGFVLGIEGGIDENKFAILTAKTVSGNSIVIGSTDAVKIFGDGVVTSAGYMYFGKDEVGVEGNTTSNMQSNFGSLSFQSDKWLGVASIMSEKMYATVLGGPSILGGKFSSKDLNTSAGAVVKWNSDGRMETYFANGSYSSNKMSFSAYAYGKNEEQSNYGATMVLKDVFGKGYNIVLFGAKNNNEITLNEQQQKEWQSILKEVNSLQANLNNPGAKPSDFMRQMNSIVQRSLALLPENSLADPENNLSIGLETPFGLVTKISRSQVLRQPTEEEIAEGNTKPKLTYVFSTSTLDLSNGTTIGFTGGFVADKGGISDNTLKYEIGGKVITGKTAFGVKYLQFGKDQAFQSNVVYKDDALLVGITSNIFGSGNHTEEFVISKDKFKASFQNVKQGDLSAQLVAFSMGLDQYYQYVVGVQARYSQMNSAINRGVGLELVFRPFKESNITLGFNGRYEWVNTPAGKFDDFGVRFNFTKRF